MTAQSCRRTLLRRLAAAPKNVPRRVSRRRGAFSTDSAGKRSRTFHSSSLFVHSTPMSSRASARRLQRLRDAQAEVDAVGVSEDRHNRTRWINAHDKLFFAKREMEKPPRHLRE